MGAGAPMGAKGGGGQTALAAAKAKTQGVQQGFQQGQKAAQSNALSQLANNSGQLRGVAVRRPNLASSLSEAPVGVAGMMNGQAPQFANAARAANLAQPRKGPAAGGPGIQGIDQYRDPSKFGKRPEQTMLDQQQDGINRYEYNDPPPQSGYRDTSTPESQRRLAAHNARRKAEAEDPTLALLRQMQQMGSMGSQQNLLGMLGAGTVNPFLRKLLEEQLLGEEVG